MPTKRRPWWQVLLFAAAVAIVFGSIVSGVSVWLAPRQDANEAREREAALRALLGCEPELAALLADEEGAGFAARLVDLDTGCYERGLDATCFDVEGAALDPRQRRDLDPSEDIAGIAHRPNRVVIYEVRREGELAMVVLPVYGLGYAGRIEAFLSLEPDLETVSSFIIHAHGETPGLGGQIGDPQWQASWRGKRLRDESGELRIGVASRGGGEAPAYEVDAISGATITAKGVTNLLRFWLGDLGYAPLMRNLQSGAACVAADTET